MLHDLLKYLAVFSTSMVKFVGGPLVGTAFGLPFWATAIFTALGMMATVILFSTILGDKFKAFILKIFYKKVLFLFGNAN